MVNLLSDAARTVNPIALSTVKLAQQAGASSSREIQRASQMLATGQRFTSASEDAAGVALQQHFRAEVSAVAQVTNDIHRGLGLTQVADTGLRHISSALQRMREIAIQASTGTYNNDQRAALNAEYSALRSGIDATADAATIFGKFPLAKALPPDPLNRGDLGSTNSIVTRLPSGELKNFSSGLVSLCYIPTGLRNIQLNLDSFGADDDLQIFTKSGKHLVGTPVSGTTDVVWSQRGVTTAASATATVMTAANGFDAGATNDPSHLPAHGSQYDTTALPLVTNYNGMSLRYSGDGNYSDSAPGTNDGSVPLGRRIERISIDTVTEDLIVLSVGSGSFNITATWEPPPPRPESRSSQPVSVLVRAVAGSPQYMTLEPAPSDAETLGLSNTGIHTAAGAQAAIERIDTALTTIAGYTARMASYQSRLTHAADGLQDTQLRMTQSRSQVADADMAAGAASLARAQALYDASQRVIGMAHRTSDAEVRLMQDTFRMLG